LCQIFFEIGHLEEKEEEEEDDDDDGTWETFT
jgi:hypothetical protein